MASGVLILSGKLYVQLFRPFFLMEDITWNFILLIIAFLWAIIFTLKMLFQSEKFIGVLVRKEPIVIEYKVTTYLYFVRDSNGAEVGVELEHPYFGDINEPMGLIVERKSNKVITIIHPKRLVYVHLVYGFISATLVYFAFHRFLYPGFYQYIVPVFAIVAAIIYVFQEVNLKKKIAETKTQTVAIVESQIIDSAESNYYISKVLFATLNGQKVVFYCSDVKREKGEQLAVFYDPNYPEFAILK